MTNLKILISAVIASFIGLQAHATDLKVGDEAPLFSLQTHEAKEFNLNERKGNWTVLYFYPKAGTPGCTKQACAFRDGIKAIRDLGADVYGISTDSVKSLQAFHNEHKLNFILLSDEAGKVVKNYGVSMPLLNVAKTWTFIIGPDLKIKEIEKDVDPLADAKHVAATIQSLKSSK